VRVNDAVVGTALLLFSVALIAYTRTFPSVPGQAYGPDLLPGLIGIGLGACGVALIAKGARERRAAPLVRLPDWARSPRLSVGFALGVGAVVFYICAVEALGFIPTVFVLLSTLFLWLRGRPVSSLALAGAITVATHVTFHDLLLVPLPWGLLQPLVW
jgi:putative tricarboxylic transport membrane protein